MIIVSYVDDQVRLYCENSDDVNALAPIMKTFKTVGYEGNGLFFIGVEEVEILNHALIPVKDKLQISPSFIEWKKKYLNSRPAIIKVGVIESKIVQGGEKLPHKEIEDATKFFLKAALAMDKYKSGKWDGYINLYHRWDHTFPTGLLEDVKDVLNRQGILFRVEYLYDRFPAKQFNWIINDGITPDPDQLEAVELAKGKRGVVKAPTGFGKTAILAKRLTAEQGVPTLFVANKKSLLDDAADEFRRGIEGLNYSDVIQIKDGWFGGTKLGPDTKAESIKPLTAPIIVATIQSLHARLQDERTKPHLLYWLQNVCKFVMVDECQAVGTKQWDEVLNECYAPYRVFLSATPRRTDGGTIKLMAGSGPILFTTTAEEQIEKGRLCEVDIGYKVFDHKIFDDDDSNIEYSDTYRVRIVENESRNLENVIKPTLEMLEEQRIVLVLINIIDHGHILRDMFIRSGIDPKDIMFVWGETPDKIRTSAIAKFKRGELKIMIGSTIFDAGVNVPAISGVVIAGAGNSEITLIQKIGRGARTCDYKKLLGYTPKFIADNNGKKITKVIDTLDLNTKFFHKQGKNRYYNASQEFGKDRVHIVGGDKSALKKQSKASKQLTQNVDQFSAQLAMLDEFAK